MSECSTCGDGSACGEAVQHPDCPRNHDSGGIFFSGEAYQGWMNALERLKEYCVRVNDRDWILAGTDQPADSDEVGLWLTPADQAGEVIEGAPREFFKWSDIDRIYVY